MHLSWELAGPFFGGSSKHKPRQRDPRLLLGAQPRRACSRGQCSAAARTSAPKHGRLGRRASEGQDPECVRGVSNTASEYFLRRNPPDWFQEVQVFGHWTCFGVLRVDHICRFGISSSSSQKASKCADSSSIKTSAPPLPESARTLEVEGGKEGGFRHLADTFQNLERVLCPPA